MKGKARLAAAALLTAGLASAGQPSAKDTIDKVLTMRVEGTVAIDENGNVLAHTIDTTLDPQFETLVESAIAQWKFMPVTVGGKPARAKSDMRVTLGARELEGGAMEVKVDNVFFFDRKKKGAASEIANAWPDRTPQIEVDTMTRMIKFPRGLRVNGMTTLAVRANPDGTVADVVPTQCSLYFVRASEKQVADACRSITTSAVAAIRSWKLKVALNGADPTADNLTFVLPVEWRMQGDERLIERTAKAGAWRGEARTLFTQAPWLKPDGFTQRVGTSDVDDNEMMPARSPLQFRDDTKPRAM